MECTRVCGKAAFFGDGTTGSEEGGRDCLINIVDIVEIVEIVWGGEKCVSQLAQKISDMIR